MSYKIHALKQLNSYHIWKKEELEEPLNNLKGKVIAIIPITRGGLGCETEQIWIVEEVT